LGGVENIVNLVKAFLEIMKKFFIDLLGKFQEIFEIVKNFINHERFFLQASRPFGWEMVAWK
jgi:hypothetical protein